MESNLYILLYKFKKYETNGPSLISDYRTTDPLSCLTKGGICVEGVGGSRGYVSWESVARSHRTREP